MAEIYAAQIISVGTIPENVEFFNVLVAYRAGFGSLYKVYMADFTQGLYTPSETPPSLGEPGEPAGGGGSYVWG